VDNLAVGPEWYVSKGGWKFDIHGDMVFVGYSSYKYTLFGV